MNDYKTYCSSTFLCYFPLIPLSFFSGNRERKKGKRAALRAIAECFRHCSGDAGFTLSGAVLQMVQRKEKMQQAEPGKYLSHVG